MRIFIASGIFHPESGGPATYLYHLLPDLIARGHHVSALTFGDAPAHDYSYPLTRISRHQNYVARQMAYRKAARRLWPDHDLAYVHSLGLPLPIEVRPRVGKIVGDKAWERAINKGWISPTTDIDVFQQQRQPPLAEAEKWRRARDARQFDRVIVPSLYLERMVVGWGVNADRVSVVYNAFQAVSPPSETRDEARAAFDLPSGPLLLTVARLVPWKGVDHTLEALAALPEIRLVVAGDGPDRPRLEALSRDLGMADRVRFLGQVARARTPLLFRAADYTLLYSDYEGLPHVLLESLQIGTPVIASSKGGNPEVVQDGVNGLLAPYASVTALIHTFNHAFKPGTRETLAANSRVNLDRFAWDRMVEDTLAVLKSVVD